MADKKISQLTDGTSLQSGDSLVVARSGNNFKVDPTQFGSDISLGDNVKAIFGAGSDLQIYHDGSQSYIVDNGQGNLNIYGANVVLGDLSGSKYFEAQDNGQSIIYANGSQKLTTTSTGIDVTGTVTADGLSVDTGGSAVEFNHSATGPTLRFNNTDLTPADGQQLARIEFSTGDAGVTTDEVYLQITGDGTGGAAFFDIMTGDGTPTKTARFNVGGDISFYEDTGTTPKFFWDASAESLGIGTTSPTATLTVESGTDASIDIIGTSGSAQDTFIRFDAPDTGVAYFGVDDSEGLLKINNGNGLSAINHLVIDTSGNVGIGTSSPGAPLEISKTEDATIRLNYGNPGFSDGEDYYGGVEFYSTETAYGGPAVSAYIRAIHTRGGTAHNNADAGLIFGTSTASDSLPATERMRIEAAYGRVGIGTSSPRQQLEVNGNIIADGIYLGGTVAANLLDDYEEGDWTPTYAGGGLAGITYATQIGKYTKVGNMVTVWFRIATSGTFTATSGAITVSGLPFTATSTLARGALSLHDSTRWTSNPPVAGRVTQSTAVVNLISDFDKTGGGTDPTTTNSTDMLSASGTNNTLEGSLTYFV